MPSVARNAAGGLLRVAYQTRIHDVGLRLVELNPSGPADPVGRATPLADTTEGRDCSARFSPDASQIAFYSIRSGEGRMWLINRDGSSLRPLTPVVAQEIKPGAWSPDGRRLVFDAAIEGNGDIYITDTGGSQPFRLTSEPSTEVVPSWSPDGRTIYFASDRSGSYQIWKAPAAGGSARQLTFKGGFQPQPSADGTYVYYVTDHPGLHRPNVLKRVPAAGGEESTVLEGVLFNYWTTTTKGIYLLLPEQGRGYLETYDTDTGQRTRVGALPFPPAWPHCGFMRVSQDGRYLVANHTDRNEMNLGVLDVLR
jgi:dipeptidyl aminopeptidase/acylaminoacyl peptidase